MIKPVLFVKETLAEATKVLTSREGLKNLYGVSLYRNAVYLMLNSAILAITGFFFWVLAARLYPVEGVGFASAAISAMGLLALLSTLGLDFGLIRFLPNAGEKAGAIINSCLTISGLASVILALIFLAGLNIWSPALLPIREQHIFVAAFVLFTGASALKSFTHVTFIANRRANFALAQGVLFGLLRFIPLVVLAASFHTFGIFASWGIAWAIALGVGIFLFLPKIQAGYRPLPTINRHAVNDMMRFSLANYAANAVWIIPSFVLPLMVINLLGAEPNAYFYMAWTISSVLFIIPMAISNSLFAEGSHSKERLGGDIKRSLKFTLVLIIPAIIIIFLLGDRILLLFGKAYSESGTRLLWLIAISALPVSLNYIYFSAKRVQMKMKGVIALSAFTTVTTLALSYILLPRMGIIGAGIAWIAGQGLGSLVVLAFLKRDGWKL